MRSFNNQYFSTDNLYNKPAFISFNNADFLMHSEILLPGIPAYISEKKYFNEVKDIKQEFSRKVSCITDILTDKNLLDFLS